jgi:hypothetical protein
MEMARPLTFCHRGSASGGQRRRKECQIRRDGWEPYRLLDVVAWLLRQPEDAITVQELVDLYRTARRTPAGS